MYLITITYTSGTTDTFTVFSSSLEETESLLPKEGIISTLIEEL